MSVDVSTTAPLPPLPEDSTARLMRMLESVRLEKVDIEAEVALMSQRTACPQCQSLESWEDSSWCPSCGYHPKLGRAMTPDEIESTRAPRQSASSGWLVWLGLGILVLIGLNLMIRVSIPDGADRGPLGRIQFIVGVSLVLAAQFRAYLFAAQARDRFFFSSILFEPVQIWRPVVQQLPRTRYSCYWGIWGVMAMMLALFVTGVDFGGMISGMAGKKPKRSVVQMVAQTVSALTSRSFLSGTTTTSNHNPHREAGLPLVTGSPDAEAASKTAEGSQEPSGAAVAGESGSIPGDGSSDAVAQIAANFSDQPETRPALESGHRLFEAGSIPLSSSGKVRTDLNEYLVFGYMTNHAGEIRSLLLADVQTRRARYAGKLSLDELSEEECQAIQQHLDRFRASRPALRIPNQARWVRPVLQARVVHVGWTPDGQLQEGYLVALEQLPGVQPSPSGAQAVLP